MAIIEDISQQDEMFTGDRQHYFGVGASALEQIEIACRSAGVQASQVKDILDLPCGHGRVLRYMKAAFPDASITASDLLRDGVDYCAATFAARPVYSNVDPAKIPLSSENFNLVWVGSLLTHLSAQKWREFLRVFRRVLRPGGVIVFSTHGREAYHRTAAGTFNYGLNARHTARVLFSYEHTGFGYADYQGQGDYGHSLSKPAWVIAEIQKIPDLRVVHFSEAAWDNHHDVFACVRTTGWDVSGSAFVYAWGRLRRRFRK